jgi:hypothetical protein
MCYVWLCVLVLECILLSPLYLSASAGVRLEQRELLACRELSEWRNPHMNLSVAFTEALRGDIDSSTTVLTHMLHHFRYDGGSHTSPSNERISEAYHASYISELKHLPRVIFFVGGM